MPRNMEGTCLALGVILLFRFVCDIVDVAVIALSFFPLAFFVVSIPL